MRVPFLILPVKITKATCKVGGINSSFPCWPFRKLHGLQGCFELPQHKILLPKEIISYSRLYRGGTFEITYLQGQLCIGAKSMGFSELQHGSWPSLLIMMIKEHSPAEGNPPLWSSTWTGNSCFSERSSFQNLACIRITGSHHKSHGLFLVQGVGSENVYSPFAEKHRARQSTQAWPSPVNAQACGRADGSELSSYVTTRALREQARLGAVASVCGTGSDNQ